MKSHIMVYWYAVYTGTQKRDDGGMNRGALQVYQWWAVAMATMACCGQWKVWWRQQRQLRQRQKCGEITPCLY
jgi:hypothetical protein